MYWILRELHVSTSVQCMYMYTLHIALFLGDFQCWEAENGPGEKAMYNYVYCSTHEISKPIHCCRSIPVIVEHQRETRGHYQLHHQPRTINIKKLTSSMPPVDCRLSNLMQPWWGKLDTSEGRWEALDNNNSTITIITSSWISSNQERLVPVEVWLKSSYLLLKWWVCVYIYDILHVIKSTI